MRQAARYCIGVLAEQRREAFREHGARHARLAREGVHPPVLARRAVQGGERTRDAFVLQRREEALQLGRPRM